MLPSVAVGCGGGGGDLGFVEIISQSTWKTTAYSEDEVQYVRHHHDNQQRAMEGGEMNAS
jgi:hypothetical protein